MASLVVKAATETAMTTGRKAMAEPAPYRAMYAYTWDLVDTGPDAFVDEMAGIGVNTVAVAASYHAGKFIRPKGTSGKVYFPEDGVAHCRVHPEKYGKIKRR